MAGDLSDAPSSYQRIIEGKDEKPQVFSVVIILKENEIKEDWRALMILRLDEKHYLKSSLKLWLEVLLYRETSRGLTQTFFCKLWKLSFVLETTRQLLCA